VFVFDAESLKICLDGLPGSVGDKDYTTLVHIENAEGHIYNALIVAFDVDAKQFSFRNGNHDYSM
jgi:hypothetical protein